MSKKFNYIVTDPCYLVPHEIWAEVCDKTKTKSNDVFVEELTKHLPKGSVAHSTGVGDYINSVSPVYEDTTVNIVQSCFTVDSGFLCITPVEDPTPYEVDTRFAIIESEEELTYGFDTSHLDWAVAEFSHGEKEVAQSEPYDID